jgi:hypothetical protein
MVPMFALQALPLVEHLPVSRRFVFPFIALPILFLLLTEIFNGTVAYRWKVDAGCGWHFIPLSLRYTKRLELRVPASHWAQY